MKIIFWGDINCFARHKLIHYLILYITEAFQLKNILALTVIKRFWRSLTHILICFSSLRIKYHDMNIISVRVEPPDGLAGLCLVSSLSHSWGRFKFFSLSFLSYFGLIISCIWLCKDELCSKDDFFLCSDIYPISVIFVILWWEIGAISSFLVYQSYFHGMSQP